MRVMTDEAGSAAGLGTAAEAKARIADLMAGFSTETTPGGAAKVADFREHLAPGTTVYVTFLADPVAATLPDTYLRAEPLPHRDAAGQPGAVLSLRGQQVVAGRSPKVGAGPLAPGTPDYASLPLELWTRLLARHRRAATPAMLGYGDPAGLWRLRTAIAGYCRACRAVDCEPEQVLVVAGAQQGLDLAARLLLDPGDSVWIEEPGYPGARGALSANGARLCPVPMDEAGLDLEFGARTHPDPKLIYLTPSHAYPSGVTMSLTRRLELLAYCERVGAWIVEDDYDSEYRYAGRPLASIKGLSRNGRGI